MIEWFMHWFFGKHSWSAEDADGNPVDRAVCRRCGLVAIESKYDLGICGQCLSLVVYDDDDAHLCCDCGGRNRRAVLTKGSHGEAEE